MYPAQFGILGQLLSHIVKVGKKHPVKYLQKNSCTYPIIHGVLLAIIYLRHNGTFIQTLTF